MFTKSPSSRHSPASLLLLTAGHCFYNGHYPLCAVQDSQLWPFLCLCLHVSPLSPFHVPSSHPGSLPLPLLDIFGWTVSSMKSLEQSGSMYDLLDQPTPSVMFSGMIYVSITTPTTVCHDASTSLTVFISVSILQTVGSMTTLAGWCSLLNPHRWASCLARKKQRPVSRWRGIRVPCYRPI